MIKMFAFLGAAVAALASFLFVATAEAGGGAPDLRFRARMTGTGTLMSGKSDYRERQRGNLFEQRFNVEIEDAQPDTTYEIHINGNLFGTVTSNSLGFAELEFRTFTPDDTPGDDHPPLPQDFPRLGAGDTISVGPVSGAYAER